ncbi:MAG: helix-turn-helix domain-containing protein [Crenarchaeota archaeon]|nr:helix-turn-helix domain-containing protein [Thermoproteota archaeon]
MEEDNKGFKTLSDIFKALGFPVRVEILKILERNPLRYSELMKTVRLDRFSDAGKFAYHLSKLMENGLVEYKPESKIYVITPLGKDVLNHAMNLFESLRRKENVLLVRRTDSSIELFDRKRIEECLVREAGMDQDTAETIALEIEERLYSLGIKYLTAPLIREYVNAVLLEKKMENYRHRLTRLGLPVHDVSELISIKRDLDDVVNEAGEEVLRQYAFLVKLPRQVGDAHLSGIININHLASFMFKPDEPVNSLTSLSLVKTYSFIPFSDSQSSFKQVAWRIVEAFSSSSMHANSLLLDGEDFETIEEFLKSIAISQSRWNVILNVKLESIVLEFLRRLAEIAEKTVLSNLSLSLVGYDKKVFEDGFVNSLMKYLNAGGALLLAGSQNSCPTHHLAVLNDDADNYVRTGVLSSASLNLPRILENASLNEDAFWKSLSEIVNSIVETFELKRESLRSIIEDRKLLPLSCRINGETYFLAEKGCSIIELTGLYNAAFRLANSDSSASLLEAEKIVKKVNELANKSSKRENRVLVSLVSHEEAVRRFGGSLVNVFPRNMALEEWFRFESRLKSLTPESNIIYLNGLEELGSLRKTGKTSFLIYSPKTMCASCGRIYPASEEKCFCGSYLRTVS